MYGHPVRFYYPQHVLGDFRRFNADIPTLFFNAVSDDARELSGAIVQLVHRLRQKHVERIDATTAAITQLMDNYKVAKAMAIRRQVIGSLEVFVRQHAALPAQLNPPHGFLISQLDRLHPSAVWATTRRQGGWYNFDVYNALGAGAQREAKRRTEPAFGELFGIVNNMLGNKELRSAHPFLREVLANAVQWKEAFLETVHQTGAEIFRPALQDDREFWDRCRDRWGRGGGYKDDIGGFFRMWFEVPQRQHLHNALEAKIVQAWEQKVLDPLRALCAADKE